MTLVECNELAPMWCLVTHQYERTDSIGGPAFT